MLNFLRTNQPFFFILYAWVLILLVLAIQYVEPVVYSEKLPYIELLEMPRLFYYLMFSGLIFFTAYKINRIVNKSVLFPKSFYLSGFIYLVLMVLYGPIEYLLFPIVSNLFVVLAVGEFFQIFRNESCKNLIFKANLYLLFSALLCPVTVFLIPVSWVILFIIRPFDWREYFMPLLVLIITGFYIVPLGLLNNELYLWIKLWWGSSQVISFLPKNISFLFYILFLAIGLLLSINPISSTFINSNNRYKKITWVIISVLFFTLCVAIVSVFVLGAKTPFIYPFFIPMSIIISTGLIRSRFKWLLDLSLIIFILGVFIVNLF